MSILRMLLLTMAIANVWASGPAMAARHDAVFAPSAASGDAVFEKEEEEKEEPARPISEDEV